MKYLLPLSANSETMSPDDPAVETPRSALHALPPIGLGTPEVESLTSYFCRLSNSHSCTTNDLTKFIIETLQPGRWDTFQMFIGKARFVWYQRSISGIGDSALDWASVLTELTSVTTLDRLTLLPLQECVASKGLMATRARWCPHCFTEDQENGRQPYFRLAWDIGLNRVCAKHGTSLISCCPHCDRANVRHCATFVVPGWCTSCGNFLGSVADEPPCTSSDEAELPLVHKQALCIGHLLAATSQPSEEESTPVADLNALHEAIELLIEKMDNGVPARFAARLGVRKSTVHFWHKNHAPLTWDALVRIGMHCNISLPALMRGELGSWAPPSTNAQLALSLEYPVSPKHRPRRQHDWEHIRQTLRDELKQGEPRSVTEMAQALEVDVRLLYIRATEEARQLGAHYVRYLRHRCAVKQFAIYEELEFAAGYLASDGQGVSTQKIRERLGQDRLNQARNLYTALRGIAAQAHSDASLGEDPWGHR